MIQQNQEEILIDTGDQKFLLHHKGILKRIRKNLKYIEECYEEWKSYIGYNGVFDLFLDDYLLLEFGEEYLRARKIIYPIANY